jgi:hypothetical protein
MPWKRAGTVRKTSDKLRILLLFPLPSSETRSDPSPTLCLNGKVVFAVFPVERMDLDQIDSLFCERCQDPDKRAGNMFQPECKERPVSFLDGWGISGERSKKKNTVEASSTALKLSRSSLHLKYCDRCRRAPGHAEGELVQW